MEKIDLRATRDGTGIWPWHVEALELFLMVQTQWRVVSGLNGNRALGLDYTALKATFDMQGIEVTEKLFTQLRCIEAGACDAINGVRS